MFVIIRPKIYFLNDLNFYLPDIMLKPTETSKKVESFERKNSNYKESI